MPQIHYSVILQVFLLHFQLKISNFGSYIYNIFCHFSRVHFYAFYVNNSLLSLFPFRLRDFLVIHPLSLVDKIWIPFVLLNYGYIFTVEKETGYCQEKLNPAVSSGAVFILSFVLCNQVFIFSNFCPFWCSVFFFC